MIDIRTQALLDEMDRMQGDVTNRTFKKFARQLRQAIEAEARSTPAEALDANIIEDILADAESDGIIGPDYTPRRFAQYIAAKYARLRSRCDCGHALRDHYANPDSDTLPQPCAECPCDHFVEVETDD